MNLGFLKDFAKKVSNQFMEVYDPVVVPITSRQCSTCEPYKRAGFVYTYAGQWVACWSCNQGMRVGNVAMPPERMPGIVQAMQSNVHGVSNADPSKKWMPPSELNARVRVPVIELPKEKKVVDVFSYVNTVQYPQHRQKLYRNFICERCKERYAHQPMNVNKMCTMWGCTGIVKEQKEVHCRAIPHGSARQILNFIHLVQAIDKDWIVPQTCGKCKGYIIKAPVLDFHKMFQLAKQCGLHKLKQKCWKEDCDGKPVNP